MSITRDFSVIFKRYNAGLKYLEQCEIQAKMRFFYVCKKLLISIGKTDDLKTRYCSKSLGSKLLRITWFIEYAGKPTISHINYDTFSKFWRIFVSTSETKVFKITRFISEIYRADLRLRILGLHGISINPVVLSSLVSRLFDQIRIFTPLEFPADI